MCLPCVCECLRGPKDGVQSPGSGLWSHNRGAGTWILVLWKISEFSYPLSHFSKPHRHLIYGYYVAIDSIDILRTLRQTVFFRRLRCWTKQEARLSTDSTSLFKYLYSSLTERFPQDRFPSSCTVLSGVACFPSLSPILIIPFISRCKNHMASGGGVHLQRQK